MTFLSPEDSLDYLWELAIAKHNPPSALIVELRENDADPETLQPVERCGRVVLWTVEIHGSSYRMITCPGNESIWEYDDDGRFEEAAELSEFDI